MKKINKNKGIIIKTIDYKENAVIATIFTEIGKVPCIIRGAKKLNSSTKRFASPLTLIEFNYTTSNSLSTFTEGAIIDNYNNLKEDLDKYNTCSVILEKLNYFLDQVSDYQVLFNFLTELFDLMKTSIHYHVLALIFEIKLLYLLGVSPSFNRCPLCNKKAINGALLISSGGYICEDCQFARTTSLNILESNYLKLLYSTKIKDITLKLLEQIKEYPNIFNIIDEYYAYHLDFESKVKKIIKKIG